MERCDVLVVGGGPAGSSAARALVAGGLDVLLVDRAEFPRDKVCAGWITPDAFEELAIDSEGYRAGGRTLQPITAFRVGHLGGRLGGHRVARPIHVSYREPVSFGIRRCELDDYLLRRSGARLRLGCAVRSLERTSGGWCVDGTIETPLLIGAGGHGCPVARQLGSSLDDPSALVVAQEIELRLDERAGRCAVARECPELYFCEDLKGYGWCFRKGEYLNVGLGRLDRQGLRRHVHDFVTWLSRQGRIDLADGALGREAFKGHAYLVRNQRRRSPVGDRVLLVGDALGLAHPASGEGITPAVESGLLAARVVLAAQSTAAQAGYDATALAPYRALLEERFGRLNRSPAQNGAPGGSASWRTALASRLLRSRWFVRRVVLDRWFLHRTRQPLAAVPIATRSAASKENLPLGPGYREEARG